MKDTKKRKVIHYCLDCDKPFKVEQGSRQQYCDDCIVKKVKHIKE